MLIIAVIVGAVVGAAWADAFGCAAGALLGWLLVRSYRQEQQLAGLQQAVELLQNPGSGRQDKTSADTPGATGLAVVETAAAPSPRGAAPLLRPGQPASFDVHTDADPTIGPQTPRPTVQGESALVRPEAVPAPAGSTVRDAVAGTPLAPPGNATTPPPRPHEPGALDAARRWLFGGNTIVKAGVGILFIGLAFLAKYATEHVQVPVEWRLAGIGAVALVLLGLGWRLRHQRAAYAQVLQGGAVAVLYLTLFVAFRFYGVLAAGPVFAAMAVVAALAAALAVLQDARALAVIGALGGFATPLLISTGSGNQVALFGYYLVLDLGIAAVAWHKTWRSLNLIGFVATFVVGAAWGVGRYRPEDYLSSQCFLIAFFLLFNAILLLPARRLAAADAGDPGRADTWVNGSLLFGLPAIAFALQHGLVHDTEYATAFSALVLAGFYVLMARAMRSRPRMAVTFDASLAIGIVFLTLVIPFALDARSTAGAWALEGAGLVWLGFRQSRAWPRVFGYALLLLAGAAMQWAYDRHGAPTAVFNAYLFNAVMAVGASWAAAFFVRRSALNRDATPIAQGPAVPGAAAQAEALAEPLLIGWGCLWAVVALGMQVDRFVAHPFGLSAWLAGVSAIALLCTALSARLDWPRMAFPAMGHAPVMALGVLVSALDLHSPASAGGWWAWPVALATHGLVLWRAAPRWPLSAQRAIHALGVLVLAVLGALQGRAVTESWGDVRTAWAWLGWLAAPAVLLMLLPRQATARRWPVSAAPSAYQSSAAGLLTLGLLLWTLLANVVSNGSAQPLPYVPVLNPLDLGIGVALLAAWLWLRSDAARKALQRRPQLTPALLGLAGFVWLNAMLIRAFHHFGGVPFRVGAWMDSPAVQTGITLLWATTALVLMWLSARRAARLPWMVGAALLAGVVLKLLLVDLSGTGTITRIVSFIGVGVLMLVIGYVAPLPARLASSVQPDDDVPAAQASHV